MAAIAAVRGALDAALGDDRAIGRLAARLRDACCRRPPSGLAVLAVEVAESFAVRDVAATNGGEADAVVNALALLARDVAAMPQPAALQLLPSLLQAARRHIASASIDV